MVSSSFLHIILHSVSSRGNGDQRFIIGDLFVNEGRQQATWKKTWASSAVSHDLHKAKSERMMPQELKKKKKHIWIPVIEKTTTLLWFTVNGTIQVTIQGPQELLFRKELSVNSAAFFHFGSFKPQYSHFHNQHLESDYVTCSDHTSNYCHAHFFVNKRVTQYIV